MTKDDLNRQIRNVVQISTGMAKGTVRPANQVAPVIGPLFATVLIVSDTANGNDEIKWQAVGQTNDLTETASGHRVAMASIQFFGKGAVDMATALRARLQMSAALEVMQTHGLGCGKISHVRDLSQIIKEGWEERAQIDVSFHYVGVEIATVATFGTYPITTTTGFDYANITEVFEP